MKLMTKIKAIVVLAIIALIGAVCTACAPGKELAEFKLATNTPTEVLYTNEIYFRDYIPREYGNEYKLYASYVYEDESGETITVENELQDSMVFTFEHVTDYSFKVVRNGNEKDAITHDIKCMPEVPEFILKGGATIPVGREYAVSRMAFFGRNSVIGMAVLPFSLGTMVASSVRALESWLSTSNVLMLSTSSPKKSMR